MTRMIRTVGFSAPLGRSVALLATTLALTSILGCAAPEEEEEKSASSEDAFSWGGNKTTPTPAASSRRICPASRNGFPPVNIPFKDSAECRAKCMVTCITVEGSDKMMRDAYPNAKENGGVCRSHDDCLSGFCFRNRCEPLTDPEDE